MPRTNLLSLSLTAILALLLPCGLQAQAPLTPVPFQSGVAALTPANTMIQFVGTHVGAEPNPRIGHFQEFKGEVGLDPSGKTVRSISVEIQTGSLFTPIPNLTNHLKSPDFLDVREHPTATFKTTEIAAAGQPNQYMVKGDLTLHGQTVAIEFPAVIVVADAGVTLQSDLTIDRGQFGMDKLADRVVNEVGVNLAIGRAAARGEAAASGGRAFDPMQFFRQRDANADGQLSGSELTERLRASLSDFDTDQDQAISQAEFEERVRQLMQGRPRQGDRPRSGDAQRATHE